MKRLLAVLSTLVLLTTLVSTVAAAPSGLSSFPYFIVTRVDHNAYVYLRLYNFPAGETVKVYEDLYGTMAVNGSLMSSFTADNAAEYKVEMAAIVRNQARGAIRLESTDINISGYFINSGGTSATTTTTTTTATSWVVPTFSISSVDVDNTVTISTADFPAHYTFDVLMNTYGTLGIGGTKVTSIDSGSGGALTFTFDIPSDLKGESTIAIRLESPTGGYYSYNWFHNKSSSSSSSSSPSSGTGWAY